VSECDVETSTLRTPRPNRAVEPRKNLMIFREMIVVYCESHKELVTLCGQNSGYLATLWHLGILIYLLDKRKICG
jgi:hypothetical protein